MQAAQRIQYLQENQKCDLKLTNWQFCKEYTFFEVAHLGTTLNNSLPYHIKNYNESLPTNKGAISGNTTQVLQQMIKIAFKHVDNLRKDAINRKLSLKNRRYCFEEYMRILSRGFDCVFFLSNRGQIRTMVNEAGGQIRSLTTVTNCISRLEEAGFLKRSKKINTSRCRIYNSKMIVECKDEKKGRGDVKYFLDKKLFTWCYKIIDRDTIDVNKHINLVENAENDKKNAVFSSTDNQGVKDAKIKNLYQPFYDNKMETLKTLKNNGGKVTDKKGVPSSQIKNKTSQSDGNNKKGNKQSKSPTKINRKNQPSKFKKIKEENFSPPREILNVDKYRETLIKANEIDQKTPQKEADMYALMLWQMCVKLIFLPFGWKRESLFTVEKEAKRMLKVQMWRLGYEDLEAAFSIVAYSILKAHNWLEKRNLEENSFKPYHPLTYLNPDLDYRMGLLHHVIDDWVLGKEFKNLWNRKLKYKKQTSNMMCRQAAFKWFRKFVEAFRDGGFSSGMMQMRYGEKQIRIYCGRMKVSAETRDSILKDYMNAVSSISTEMHKLGNEEINVFEVAWKAFEKRQK